MLRIYILQNHRGFAECADATLDLMFIYGKEARNQKQEIASYKRSHNVDNHEISFLYH